MQKIHLLLLSLNRSYAVPLKIYRM